MISPRARLLISTRMVILLEVVHTRVGINQFSYEPNVAEEILFLSEVLETNWIDIC